ncbi:hypothetical protein FPHOBKDP_00032 [Listeria phage LPJP1]|nr:hypothetical protein FPHOBKDP_00032 [Listeria phage LPJP1]
MNIMDTYKGRFINQLRLFIGVLFNLDMTKKEDINDPEWFRFSYRVKYNKMYMKFITKNQTKIFWEYIDHSIYKHMTIEEYSQNIDFIPWDSHIVMHCNYSKEFLIKFSQYMKKNIYYANLDEKTLYELISVYIDDDCWDIISRRQKLSIDFIEIYWYKLNHKEVLMNQRSITSEFIIKHITECFPYINDVLVLNENIVKSEKLDNIISMINI